jgi:hypothetical protein
MQGDGDEAQCPSHLCSHLGFSSTFEQSSLICNRRLALEDSFSCDCARRRYRYRYLHGWTTTSHEFLHFAVTIDITLSSPGHPSSSKEAWRQRSRQQEVLVHTGSTLAVRAFSSGLQLHSERRCQSFRNVPL